MGNENRFDKFKNGVINSIGFIVVGAIVAVYLVRSFVTIGETGKSVAEIIADGVFALLFGWGIKVLLTYQGTLSGMQNKQMQDTIKQHGEAVGKIEKFLPSLQAFCDKKNAELRISKRRLILTKELLRYEDVFCDDPTRLQAVITERLKQLDEEVTINTNDFSSWKRKRNTIRKKRKLRKKIMRVVKKANNVQFVALSENSLTSDSGNGADPYRFPIPIGKHIAKKSVKLFFSAILFAVVFGYYGYKLVSDPSWANFIGGLIQIGSFLAMGAIQFVREYLYVIDTYRKGIVRKIDLLDQFFEEASKANGVITVPVEIVKVKASDNKQTNLEKYISDQEVRENAE